MLNLIKQNRLRQFSAFQYLYFNIIDFVILCSDYWSSYQRRKNMSWEVCSSISTFYKPSTKKKLFLTKYWKTVNIIWLEIITNRYIWLLTQFHCHIRWHFYRPYQSFCKSGLYSNFSQFTIGQIMYIMYCYKQSIFL